MTDKLGPTGEFPYGKLNADDEGVLMSVIRQEAGDVRIDFNHKVAWIAFPPDAALEFASTIVKHAMALKREPR
jgi:hypothetical protein